MIGQLSGFNSMDLSLMFSPTGSPRPTSPGSDFATLRSRTNSFTSSVGRSEPDRDGKDTCGTNFQSGINNQIFPPVGMIPVSMMGPDSNSGDSSSSNVELSDTNRGEKIFQMTPQLFTDCSYSVSSTNSLTSDRSRPTSSTTLTSNPSTESISKVDLSAVMENYKPQLKLDMTKEKLGIESNSNYI